MNFLIAGGDCAALYAGLLLKKRLPGCNVTIAGTHDGTPFGPQALVNPVLGEMFLADSAVAQAAARLVRRSDEFSVYREAGGGRSERETIPGLHYSFADTEGLRGVLEALAVDAGCAMRCSVGAELVDSAHFVLVSRWSELEDLGCDPAGFEIDSQNSGRFCAFFTVDRPSATQTFAFSETANGPVAAMVAPAGANRSFLVVEAANGTIAAAGLTGTVASKIEQFAAEVFRPALEDATPVLQGNSFRQTPVHRTGRRQTGKTIVFGAAAAAMHPMLGLQLRFDLEEAQSLAAALVRYVDGDGSAALEGWAEERQAKAASLARAAAAGAEWIAHAHRAFHLPMEQFAFACATRSLRMGYKRIREASRDFANRLDATVAAVPVAGVNAPPPPMFAPYELRGMQTINRMVFSPMCMYSAVDGTVNDFHLAHLGARAVGGFGLVIAEMTNVTAQGRMTPGCAGMYAPEHVPAWKRIVDFTHEHTQAKIGIQLAHAGRKGSIGRSWDKYVPVKDDDVWEVIAPSAIPFTPDRPLPREMTKADIVATVEAFAKAARMAEEAGFDMIELHFAHGYLLSEFISPLANRRGDAYGGSLANRMRFPLEVFEAVRAVYPANKPIAARISANDFRPDGVTPEESIEISRMLKEAGVDIVAVSTAGVTADRRPAAMSRLYQLALSEAIRHEAQVPTMAIGGIVSHTDCNMIVASGRADLCVMARGAMNEPYFPHHAANEQGYRFPWPMPYTRADETVIRQS
ncbi:MAG: bifunctional salicylyl-CoA 5-hydroxylase/oxidoreductase [Beijerinckiaceae bacterium]